MLGTPIRKECLFKQYKRCSCQKGVCQVSVPDEGKFCNEPILSPGIVAKGVWFGQGSLLQGAGMVVGCETEWKQ